MKKRLVIASVIIIGLFINLFLSPSQNFDGNTYTAFQLIFLVSQHWFFIYFSIISILLFLGLFLHISSLFEIGKRKYIIYIWLICFFLIITLSLIRMSYLEKNNLVDNSILFFEAFISFFGMILLIIVELLAMLFVNTKKKERGKYTSIILIVFLFFTTTTLFQIYGLKAAALLIIFVFLVKFIWNLFSKNKLRK